MNRLFKLKSQKRVLVPRHNLDIYLSKHVPQEAVNLQKAVTKKLSEKQRSFKECEVDWFQALKVTKLVTINK